jgi:hypothetical protein
MTPIKTCAVTLGALALALAGLIACERKTEGPANVYAADKADGGVSNPNAVGADNRVNPDSVDSSVGYSDRTNTAQRP